MKKEDIAQFYDDFSAKQVKTGANERLISLFKRMLQLGLRKDSKVLELGCGVGIFTNLLGKKIKTGKIEAVDLSEKSIDCARKLLKNRKEVHFEVSDVVHYEPKFSDFDFITLLDVIEHIPINQHEELFGNLAKICSEKAQILINIPNPDYLNFTRENNPELLQVIDQEIPLLPLLTIFEKYSLELVHFEKYGIWEVEDYHFMIVRKKRKFNLTHLSDLRNISEKVAHKISTKIDTIKYH